MNLNLLERIILTVVLVMKCEEVRFWVIRAVMTVLQSPEAKNIPLLLGSSGDGKM